MTVVSGGASAWTAERVCTAAIQAFRLLPTMPVYAPRRGGLAAVLPEQDAGPLAILSFSETVLGYDAPERRALLVWARAKATGGDVGGSIRQYCAEHGLSLNTFTRRHKRACQRIADALNQTTARTAVREVAPHLEASVPELAATGW
jgi:hypothetical protein